ncbi:Gfo/Idh/MocA family protein [Aureimonas frigidaquae]|uniref:Oxidoreductase domain-containing protein n=1 Tax=Aureimonas frigidaquae TaxID=424757 RepID=A0A0P0Z298_9HYPH|nr:Gfo/Idh/MocA family oxidoreductase [Aureimonas frigidaquae]BAT28037.1 oxidoreductase domain-containing protein [Aureimonas frigidaquae]
MAPNGPTLRGTLVGCGFFAANQMHAWTGIDGVEMVALCDRDEARARDMAARFGVTQVFTDAARMLAEVQPDFVDIATTAPSHRALVELAAEAGTPVICQKPFAPTLADARAMVQACERAGVPLMVHENFRWQSAIRAAASELHSGAIGKPFFGRVTFRSGFDVYAAQPYLAEGARFIIEDLGIHALDVARFLFGDVAMVTARTARINPRIAGEDVATMLLDHDSGVTSIVDCSYATRAAEELFPQALLEIDGADGTIRLDRNYQLTVTNAAGTRSSDVSPQLLPWAERPWHNIQESVARIQEHWVDCLRTGREPETCGRDNVKTLALVEAAYLSAERQTSVIPSEL